MQQNLISSFKQLVFSDICLLRQTRASSSTCHKKEVVETKKQSWLHFLQKDYSSASCTVCTGSFMMHTGSGINKRIDKTDLLMASVSIKSYP